MSKSALFVAYNCASFTEESGDNVDEVWCIDGPSMLAEVGKGCSQDDAGNLTSSPGWNFKFQPTAVRSASLTEHRRLGNYSLVFEALSLKVLHCS